MRLPNQNSQISVLNNQESAQNTIPSQQHHHHQQQNVPTSENLTQLDPNSHTISFGSFGLDQYQNPHQQQINEQSSNNSQQQQSEESKENNQSEQQDDQSRFLRQQNKRDTRHIKKIQKRKQKNRKQSESDDNKSYISFNPSLKDQQEDLKKIKQVYSAQDHNTGFYKFNKNLNKNVEQSHKDITWVPLTRRYQQQFNHKKQKKLGSGGFGSVYSVYKKDRNLDPTKYAVKKIPINRNSKYYLQKLKQVNMLSRLSRKNPYIVFYNHSWIQNYTKEEQFYKDLNLDFQEEQKLKKKFKDIDDQAEKQKKQKQNQKSSQKSTQQNTQTNKSENKTQKSNIQNSYQIQQSQMKFQNVQKSQQPQNRTRSLDEFKLFTQVYFDENERRQLYLKTPDNSISLSQQSQQLLEHIVTDNSNKQNSINYQILYIVMQHCQTNLHKYIKLPDPKQSIKIMIQLLQGLKFLHENNIIHRDLKPQNIFLTKDKDVKIGDFGLATQVQYKSNESNQSEGSLQGGFQGQARGNVGTDLYKAPEVVGQKYDQRADIYSLGITLVEVFGTMSTFERVEKLQKIRENPNSLKRQIGVQNQCALAFQNFKIRQCISLQKSQRPLAKDLLKIWQDHYNAQMLKAITCPSNSNFSMLMKNLFKTQKQSEFKYFQKQFHQYYCNRFKQIVALYQQYQGELFQSFPLYINNRDQSIIKKQAQNDLQIGKQDMKKRQSKKFILINQQGTTYQYAQRLYDPWIVHAKQTMRILLTYNYKDIQRRRFTFQKLVQPIFPGDNKLNYFKQIYVTGFDFFYDLQKGIRHKVTWKAIQLSYRLSQLLNPDKKDKLVIYISDSRLIKRLFGHRKINQQKFYELIQSVKQKRSKGQNPSRNSIKSMLKQLLITQDLYLQTFTAWIYGQLTSLTHIVLRICGIQNNQLAQKQFKDVFKFQQILTKMLQQNDKLQKIQYVIMRPQQNCQGIFWKINTVKGFSSVQKVTLKNKKEQKAFANINIQIILNPQLTSNYKIQIQEEQQVDSQTGNQVPYDMQKLHKKGASQSTQNSINISKENAKSINKTRQDSINFSKDRKRIMDDKSLQSVKQKDQQQQQQNQGQRAGINKLLIEKTSTQTHKLSEQYFIRVISYLKEISQIQLPNIIQQIQNFFNQKIKLKTQIKIKKPYLYKQTSKYISQVSIKFPNNKNLQKQTSYITQLIHHRDEQKVVIYAQIKLLKTLYLLFPQLWCLLQKQRIKHVKDESRKLKQNDGFLKLIQMRKDVKIILQKLKRIFGSYKEQNIKNIKFEQEQILFKAPAQKKHAKQSKQEEFSSITSQRQKVKIQEQQKTKLILNDLTVNIVDGIQVNTFNCKDKAYSFRLAYYNYNNTIDKDKPILDQVHSFKIDEVDKVNFSNAKKFVFTECIVALYLKHQQLYEIAQSIKQFRQIIKNSRKKQSSKSKEHEEKQIAKSKNKGLAKQQKPTKQSPQHKKVKQSGQPKQIK